MEEERREELIKKARAEYCSDDVAVDHDAQISEGDDGDWVQAWLWLPHDDDE